jgi:hypothetical protein
MTQSVHVTVFKEGNWILLVEFRIETFSIRVTLCRPTIRAPDTRTKFTTYIKCIFCLESGYCT